MNSEPSDQLIRDYAKIVNYLIGNLCSVELSDARRAPVVTEEGSYELPEADA